MAEAGSGNGSVARPGVIEPVGSEDTLIVVERALQANQKALRMNQAALQALAPALDLVRADVAMLKGDDEPPEAPESVVVPGSSYRNRHTLVGMACRKFVHASVAARLRQWVRPPNISVGSIDIVGEEVGVARQYMAEHFLKQTDYPYLMFVDDDLLIDPDGWIRLMKWTGRYRCVAGLYYTKGEGNVPLAYLREPSKDNHEVGVWHPTLPFSDWVPGQAIEVDGTGCGFTIFHRSLFEEIEPPWFRTVCEVDVEEETFRGGTEDLYFFEKCKRKWGEDFKILLDTSVRCGHLVVDGPNEGKVY